MYVASYILTNTYCSYTYLENKYNATQLNIKLKAWKTSKYVFYYLKPGSAHIMWRAKAPPLSKKSTLPLISPTYYVTCMGGLMRKSVLYMP